MRSTASYSNYILAMLAENLRRYWAIPTVAFIVYFLSGVFPILMRYASLNDLSLYIEYSLMNQQPFFMAAHLILPVLAAIILYRYLYSAASTAVMHSLPFTRHQLFWGNYLSGLLMVGLPIVLNGLLLLIVRKPVYHRPPGDDVFLDKAASAVSEPDVFSAAAIGNWMAVSLIIVGVLFSVAVFAGMVSGNSFIHLATSYFFIFLPAMLYALLLEYFTIFLFGFHTGDMTFDLGLKLSPYLAVFANQGHFESLWIAIYLLTFIILSLFSLWLYRRRRLERAGDAYVFNLARPLICYLVSFVGMTLLGFYFYMLGENNLIMMIAGIIAGALIFFLISRMIVLKTPRIFNLESLRQVALFGLIIAIFLTGLQFDLTGFEKRRPAANDISTVSLTYPAIQNELFNEPLGVALKEPANIKAVLAFHKHILDHQAQLDQRLKSDDEFLNQITLAYNHDRLQRQIRSYSIPDRMVYGNAEFQAVFESNEYRTARATAVTEKQDRLVSAVVLPELWSDNEDITATTIIDRSQLKDLIEAVRKDIMTASYQELLNVTPSVGTIEFTYRTATDKLQFESTMVFFFRMRAGGEADRWLTEKGYGLPRLTPENVTAIEFYPPTLPEDEMATIPLPERMGKYPVQVSAGLGSPLFVVKDKKEIQSLLNSYRLTAAALGTDSETDRIYQILIKYNFPNGETGDLLGFARYSSGNMSSTRGIGMMTLRASSRYSAGT